MLTRIPEEPLYGGIPDERLYSLEKYGVTEPLQAPEDPVVQSSGVLSAALAQAALEELQNEDLTVAAGEQPRQPASTVTMAAPAPSGSSSGFDALLSGLLTTNEAAVKNAAAPSSSPLAAVPTIAWVIGGTLLVGAVLIKGLKP